MKKILILVLSLIMILVMIPVSTGVVFAEDDEYYHRNTVQESSSTWWSLKKTGLLRIWTAGINDYSDKRWNTDEYRDKITDIIINDVNRIGLKAFCSCTNIKSISIYSNISTVAKDAFCGVGTEEKPCILQFKYNQSFSDEIINSNDGCLKNGLLYLSGGIFDVRNGTPEHPWIISKTENDNVIAYITKTNDKMVLYIDGSGEMQDFDSDNPFWYDQRAYIQEVRIGNKVTNIGAVAFYTHTVNDYYAIKNITFEDNSSLECIGKDAFQSCTHLEELVLPDSVRTIQMFALNGCTNVTNLVFSSNLTTVDQQALYNLNGLKTVTFNGIVPSNFYFLNINQIVDLYLPLDYIETDKPSSSSQTWHGEYFNLITSGTAEHPWHIGKPASGSNVPTSRVKAYVSGTDLFITGTGETIDFGEGYLVTDTNKIPWKASASNITKVNISEGITGIGEQSFSDIGTTTPCNIVVPGNLITQTQSGTSFTFKGGTFDASDYFTVTFDSEGGSAVDSAIVGPLEDHKVAIPVDPTMNGYLFDGWYATNTDVLWNFDTPLTTDTTLHAKWTKSYKATVKLDGGTVSAAPANWSAISDGYAKDFRVNTSYTDILSEWNGRISKSGYTFDGWDVTTGTLVSDTDFTAKWKQNSTGGYYYIPSVDNKKNDEKLKEAEEKAKLKEDILFAQVEASSKLYKLNGKTAIKITWNIEGGELELTDLDNYEIYRSTKKNSGYGKTPYFTSSKPDYGYYVNNKGLKKGKTYYYKVRGYKVIDGEKYYTPWSTKCWRTVK